MTWHPPQQRIVHTTLPCGLEATFDRCPWGWLISIEAAPRDRLLATGLAYEYMFAQLGAQRQRRGPTEHGDRFKLIRKSRGLFRLELWLYAECGQNDDPRLAAVDLADIIGRTAERDEQERFAQ